MSKLDKRAISILVIATFLLSMIPLAHAQISFAISDVTPLGNVEYGDVLAVTGVGVMGGAEVRIFWDYAYGEYAILLNTTEGNPNGSFDCDVEVPSDTVGDHFIWATLVATGETVMYGPSITVIPKIKLSPSSGLIGDEITVEGYGFLDESKVKITFGAIVEPLTDTVETDELGYFTYNFDVPISTYDTYTITANDSDVTPNVASATFTIGASISLNPEEGPTGTVVSVSGRGWTIGNTITFSTGETSGETPVTIVGATSVTVVSGSKFSANVVIPGGVAEGDIKIWATEYSATEPVKDPSSATFDVTGLPEIEVDPTYGSPGATINVKGYNFTQIAGTEVVIELRVKDAGPLVAELVTAETNSDGTFEDTFMSPAVAFKGYDVVAEDIVYHIAAEDAFKVGLIALIINPVYGEAGTEISITGIGFAEGDYNLTFGTKLYEDYSTVKTGEAISDTFYVPNVEPGTYDLTVIDIEDNELTAMFSVTAVTEVIIDPSKAPNDYNVTFKGYNFADYVDTVDFLLYNATDEWDMTVQTTSGYPSATQTDEDGNFTAWWIVFPEADLSLGDYTVNVTGYDDFFLQVPFSVVEARVSVAPRKALFDRGDTIQFNVKNDFDFKLSYMKIWDPYDNLYWQTELFAEWLKVGDLYTVPYYLQTSGKNPMTLAQDAPMGTWFYVFYEEGTTQLTNGTFEVGPSSAAQVDQKLTEIWDSMEGITEDIDSITSEIEDEISALSGEMDDVVSDVQGMIDDITSDLAGELAGVAEDTEAAVGELEASIGDIAAAQNALADEVGDISQDTAAARQAAEDAQAGTQGLTTIVYGVVDSSSRSSSISDADKQEDRLTHLSPFLFNSSRVESLLFRMVHVYRIFSFLHSG